MIFFLVINTQGRQLEGGKAFWGSWFLSLKSVFTGSFVFTVHSEIETSWKRGPGEPHRSHKAEGKNRKGPGPAYPHRRMLAIQSMVSEYFESINGCSCYLRQDPHHLIILEKECPRRHPKVCFFKSLRHL